jgi:ethanolamine ammonia-lyase small subunit
MTLNQIIGNRKTESKIDTNLWKKLNEKYSEIKNTKKEETDNQTNNTINETLEKILTYNSKGKPTIELVSLAETAVNVQTQKEYDTLMQIYEAGNWKWITKELPTEYNSWKEYRYKTKTCINAGLSKSVPKVEINELVIFEKDNNQDYETILSLKEFYLKQNLTTEMIKELNNWYNKHKQNRKSKG